MAVKRAISKARLFSTTRLSRNATAARLRSSTISSMDGVDAYPPPTILKHAPKSVARCFPWQIEPERALELGKHVVHRALERAGVTTIFGIPGRSATEDPFSAIFTSKTMTAVIPRQEQAAGHMAEGHARATGEPGVVVVTSAHGVPSLATPMQDALMDGTLMVVLTSVAHSVSRGLDEFQVPDTVGMATACTKWSIRVASTADLEGSIAQAFHVARAGRPGPVLVDIPADLLESRIPVACLPPPSPRKLASVSANSFLPPAQDLDRVLSSAARLVDGATKPVLYVGQGMLATPSGPEVLAAFADKTSMPITTSLQGLGAFDESDPRALGMLGLHGTGYANLAMQEADLILALGARFDDRATGHVPSFAPGALAAAREGRGGIVHFEMVPKNVNKVVEATVAVIGDCAANLARLTPKVREVAMTRPRRQEWFAQIEGWKKRFPLDAYKTYNVGSGGGVRPQLAIEMLSKLVNSSSNRHGRRRTVLTTGVGQHQMWTAQHFSFQHDNDDDDSFTTGRTPLTKLITSGGLGTMGYGLPAALGAQAAFPDRLVVDIDGDASFNMALPELATAAQYGLPVKVLLLNNGEMGMVSDLQRSYYGGRFTQNRQANPDFVKLAEAMACRARRVFTEQALEDGLRWLLFEDGDGGVGVEGRERRGRKTGPALLEVVTKRDTPVWPMVPAGKGLHEFITYPEVRGEENMK